MKHTLISSMVYPFILSVDKENKFVNNHYIDFINDWNTNKNINECIANAKLFYNLITNGIDYKSYNKYSTNEFLHH